MVPVTNVSIAGPRVAVAKITRAGLVLVLLSCIHLCLISYKHPNYPKVSFKSLLEMEKGKPQLPLEKLCDQLERRKRSPLFILIKGVMFITVNVLFWKRWG